ncbi:MAG: sodium:proton antiporter NhaD [Paludibacter sp.]
MFFLIIIFLLGYAAIIFEHNLKINKTASALLTGVLMWTVYILSSTDKSLVNEQLLSHLGDISGILFFLMGAMAIVELIDAHDGFEIITDFIHSTNKRTLIWIVGFLAFFLSAILDNLTTTIIMVSLLRKLIRNQNDRLLFVGIVVIAANAGGAWSPIGDVTTTMLWIGGQISSTNIMLKLFLPSLVCLLVPLVAVTFSLKGKADRLNIVTDFSKKQHTKSQQKIILIAGILSLIFVPVFKTLTHLQPFVGMLFSVGILWVITELMHSKGDVKKKKHLTLVNALQNIDIPTILFFLGILLAVEALQSAGVLVYLAEWLTKSIGDLRVVVLSTGLLSSVVDNVPLVAAAQGMYPLNQYPMDHFIWEFLAYCAGTGGSILIIGSAAGVAAMGMEKINFFWYVKKISGLALLGYFAGAAVYLAFQYFSS